MYRLIGLTDKTLMGPARGRVLTSQAIDMVGLVFGGLDALRRVPALVTVINVNSPLRYDDWMLGGLITYARAGQPVIITPFILAGAMGPITMAGAVAQQNAEALAGVALTQLVNPGVPVIYGGFTTDTHMRSGNPSFGTPEGAWATLVGGQLARRYKLPYRTSGGLCSSSVPDAQAAYESQMSLWSSILAGANFIYHAAGWVEGGLTASYEKFILDMEAVAMMVSLLGGYAVDPDTLALPYIDQVGPGGHHFDTEHTLARFSQAFYEPLVSERLGYETWLEAGARDAAERAHQRWKELLAAYEQPRLDPAIDEALRDYVDRAKRAAGQ
jgi:trimethylamine--corrinoid protein Co-methyltransferase